MLFNFKFELKKTFLNFKFKFILNLKLKNFVYFKFVFKIFLNHYFEFKNKKQFNLYLRRRDSGVITTPLKVGGSLVCTPLKVGVSLVWEGLVKLGL